MDTKELRTGNYVKGCENKLFEVKAIAKDGISTSGNWLSPILYFEPIDLNASVLFRCGFNFVGNGYWNDKLHIHCNNNGFYVIQEQGKVIVKYIHQLQNLYFALTGEELKIEL